VGGIGAAIGLGIHNRKLRKQIEMHKAIIANLQNNMNETEKELKALKLWSFERKQKAEELKSLQLQFRENKRELVGMERQLKKAG
jgi:predicted RNase H-like nuclease (RuvC/YqgF family)